MNALRMWMLLLGVLLASTATIGSCVCVAQAVEASDKFAETFAIGKGGRPLTVPVSYQGRRLLFLLDTGAAKTCFDKFFESRLGVSSGTSSFKAPAGVRSIELYSCPDATLGRFSLSPVDTVACVDLQTIRYVTGLPIDGILGSDFCAGKILDVDFDNGRLAIHTSGSLDLEDDVSAVMLPIAMEHGVPHVTVTLPQDPQTRFAVDTGANRTSLRSELFRELVSSKDIDVLGSHSTASIAGNAESRIGRLRKMGLGRHQLTDVVLDRDDLNLLALDHLARFRVRLDLIGGRLVLQ